MEKSENKERVYSYSQWSMWVKCPASWKYKYVDGFREEPASIYGIFGTALHEVIQDYVKMCYSDSIKKADALPLDKMFTDKLVVAVRAESDSKNHGELFLTKDEFRKHLNYGYEMIACFKKNRATFFSPRKDELIGIEVELFHEFVEGTKFVAYLDLVFKSKRTGKIRILDLKTSTKGWGQWEKKDDVKLGQIVLYKHMYAKQHNIDPKGIAVQYVILKREIPDPETVEYPVKRLQIVKPVDGKIKTKALVNSVVRFIQQTSDYLPYSGIRDNNCRFCPHVKICNPSTRISEKFKWN